MNLHKCLIALGVIVGLTAGASTAQAAKGVKKKEGNGEHHHHGVVVSVEHKKGHFEIVSQQHSKKKKAGTATNGTATHRHKFKVTPSTKFFVMHGKNKVATTFAHLKKGEHVSVASHNGHADTVVIHHKHKKKSPKKPLK